MIRLLLALYPVRWRLRYGEEFAAVLEARPIGPFDVADVVLGALDAHLRRAGRQVGTTKQRGPAVSQRIGGLAAIAAGLLWLFVFAASFLGPGDGGPLSAVILLGGSLLVLVALTGLSAFQAHRYPRLVWAAFALPALSASVSIVGIVALAVIGDAPFLLGASAWYLWMTGVLGMIGGSALFAAATWRVRTLSRGAAATLLAGSLVIVPATLGMAGLAPFPGEIGLFAAVLAFALGWIGLGMSALRVSPPVTAGA